MAEVVRVINAPVERVWSVLANGWSYANWVVGTAHVRAVDEDWPDPGTRLHHTSGIWPLVLSDYTTVRAVRPPYELVMLPRLWPLGRGVVTLRLAPLGLARTRVTLQERFDRGPLSWTSTRVNDRLLHWRNTEALRRLADLAIGEWHASRYADRRRDDSDSAGGAGGAGDVGGRSAPPPSAAPSSGLSAPAPVYPLEATGIRRGVMRELFSGMIAGAAGTTALNAVTYLDMATRGRPPSHTPEQTVAALSERARMPVPGRDDTRDNRLSGLGALFGIGVGVTVGLSLAALRSLGLRMPALPGAVVAGAVAMAASDVPMTRLGVTNPRNWSRADWLSDVVPHLAYGAVTHATLASFDGERG